MKKPNYGYKKFQREMKKQKKQEEKRNRKLNKNAQQPGENVENPSAVENESSPEVK
ncbi:hypothetical protein ACFL58_01445 [Elusimicrobiota bacterium]